MGSIRNLAVFFILGLTMRVEARSAPMAYYPMFPNANTGNMTNPQISQIRDQWALYLQTKQLDALMALYSKNAMFLDSAGSRLIGQPAIRSLCHQVMTTFNTTLNLYSIVNEVSGDLAYDSGNYQETLTRTSNGATENIHGTYIMLFKHQPDGNWKILEQIWTEAPSISDQRPE